jgi:DNA-directed RNA polymerase
MKKLIEWFFMLFLRKKATEVKKEAFLERQKAVIDYAKVKKANDKYLSKYSGRKRYVKC